jgi:TolB-like protein/DNA-binding winged helix-turn-helix (wHTH) protein
MSASEQHEPARAVRAATSGGRYRVGDLLLDTQRGHVERDGVELRLPKLSFDLLVALVRRAPEIVSVDELMTLVWPGLVVGPETVAQRVKLVRDALGDDAKQPRFIAGVRGRGYRVVASVAKLGDEKSPKAQPPRGSPTRRVSRWLTAAFVAAGIVIVVIGASRMLRETGNSPAQTPPAASTHTPRIAVLPFANLSASADDTLFADGLQDEIVNALAAQTPSVEVIARTTMMGYRSRPGVGVKEIAQELGATHVVAATLRRDPQDLRFTLQLVDAKTNTVLWSHAYDLKRDNVVTLRSEVVADLAAHLVAQPSETLKAPEPITRNASAYEWYLKALVGRVTASGPYGAPADKARAVEHALTEAIDLDPAFADAYAERAAIRMLDYGYNDPPPGQLERIRADLAAAERLGPTAPKTLAVRAWYRMVIEDDNQGTLDAFSAARKAGLADPMWMLDIPMIYIAVGRPDEALATIRQALALDPASPLAVSVYAYDLLSLRRPLEALRAVNFGLTQSPEDPALLSAKAIVLLSSTSADEGTVSGFCDHDNAGARSEPSPVAAPESTDWVRSTFDCLRYTHRFDELAARLSRAGTQTRASFAFGGREPVARYRGWTSLLRGDRAGAEKVGAEIFRFLSDTDETANNRFFRSMLAAEAHLFLGDTTSAITEAREADTLPKAAFAAPNFRTAVAAVYAWSGAEDAAVDLLERLANEAPSVGPVPIARDPLYTIPLAHNARYQSLVAQLETQIRDQTKQLNESNAGR